MDTVVRRLNNFLDSVLITGDNSGIGRAMLIEFPRRGYALVLFARRKNLLENLKNEKIRKKDKEIEEMDVSQFKAVKRILEKLYEKLGV